MSEQVTQSVEPPPRLMSDELITFVPIYQERVWGGRTLSEVFGRELPDSAPYGESWELSSRPEADSVVEGGRFAGCTLTGLWRDHRREIFGEAAVGMEVDRFPLLFKILDCCDNLSIQVHPPEAVAALHGGEAKTESWYVADASPGAKIYVGVSDGIDEPTFRKAIQSGTVAEVVNIIEPTNGDVLHLPSGRLHALGAGLLIFEIQQNSDTTFRVYDWDRAGTDGKPRELHIERSLASIDFNGGIPKLRQPDGKSGVLINCDEYNVARFVVDAGESGQPGTVGEMAVITVTGGVFRCGERDFTEGDFFLVPANATVAGRELTAVGATADALVTTLPGVSATGT